MAPPQIEPRNLKGTQDRLPAQMHRRLWLFGKIREAAALFGFEPLETPVIEYADVLLGKYGEEERLVFRFRDYGDREVALRYDQTVPLARVVAQHRNEIQLPFKRYEINRCWRAEKPQKGRDREFYQADFDIIGADDLMADAEILALMSFLYSSLGFEFKIEIGHRKLLGGLLMCLGVAAELLTDAFRAVDKFDKIGPEGVYAELEQKGIPAPVGSDIINLLNSGRTDEFALDGVAERVKSVPEAETAAQELKTVFEYLARMGIEGRRLKFSPTIVRGLDYYTGIIFESFIPGVSGSIGSGGRYDDLCGLFGARDISGVGVGLGVERILLGLENLQQQPPAKTSTHVLVTVFGPEQKMESLSIVSQLREAGVNSEIYPDMDKLKKQFKYANLRGIPVVIVAGEEEIGAGMVTIRDMISGDQARVSRSQMVETALKIVYK